MDHFKAKAVNFGGILPFKLLDEKKPHLQSSSEDTEFLNLKKSMHGSTLDWLKLENHFSTSFNISRLKISKNRELINLQLNLNISFYAFGFGTIQFWINTKDEMFTSQELINIGRLLKGNNEATEDKSIQLYIYNDVAYHKNFKSYFDSQIFGKLNLNYDKSTPNFIYPLIYIGEFDNAVDKNEILDNYAKEIISITELWAISTDWVIPDKNKNILENEYYPFNFGLGLSSVGSTIEIHPKNYLDFLKKNDLNKEEQDYSERVTLSLICEVPILRYYILNYYNKHLNHFLVNLKEKKTITYFNPISIYKIIKQTIYIDKVKTEMILSTNQFRDTHFNRKSYMIKLINHFQSFLGTNLIEEAIERKLNYLNNYTSKNYKLLTTLLLIVLSIITTTLGFLNLFYFK